MTAVAEPTGTELAGVGQVDEELALSQRRGNDDRRRDLIAAGDLGRGGWRFRSSHLPASAPTPSAARSSRQRVSRLSVGSGS
jgi:hypothetical protein